MKRSLKALTFSLFVGVFAQAEMLQAHAENTLRPGLCLYLLAISLFLYAMGKDSSGPPQDFGAKPEVLWFFLIFALGAFLRIYKLGDFPRGVYFDVAALGNNALRVLHENWTPPFMLPSFAANPSWILYPMALWFHFLTPSPIHMFLFFSFLALSAFPLIYWTFRQLAGPRAALLALFLLAVMRWHLIFSRDGFRGIQILLYMFGTLGLLLHGLKARKTWIFVLAGLVFGGGLYTYQSYKAFPLLVAVCLIYEIANEPGLFRSQAKNITVFWVVFLVFSSPVLWNWAQLGSLGTRESEIFIGNEMKAQESLKPLVEKITQTALMFNRRGEIQPRNNWRDHRMLDDVTGLFFVLGFFLALFRIGRRPFFYTVAGLGVMCLPGLLSSDPVQSHRMIGATPFVALAAALALEASWEKWRQVLGKKGSFAVLALGLVLAGSLNAKTYFRDQAGDCDCWRSDSTEATIVGQKIQQSPGAFFFLEPFFYYHYTVLFLDYFESKRMAKLDVTSLPKLTEGSPGKVCFVFARGKKPTLNFVESLYPGGEEEIERDPCGTPLAYFYILPKPRPMRQNRRGLHGEYFPNADFQGSPAGARTDPLINFVNIGDFAVNQRPFSARWTGNLQVREPGNYEFQVLTSDDARLWVDGKEIPRTGLSPRGSIILERGAHFLRLAVRRPDNPDVAMDLHLLWKRPGQASFEVIPNGAYGEIRNVPSAFTRR